VKESVEAIAIDLRGETLSVDGIAHGRCTRCGEVYLDLDAGDRLQREAVARLREARGLLTQSQIRDLRQSLNLSQAAFEKLLGTGPKTVVRWEKGTVFQSATADKLMRLLIAKPELADILSGAAPREARTKSRRVQARSLATRPEAKAKQQREAS
jgi:HTH-type transcriptional regulator/antitoxin MqsA